MGAGNNYGLNEIDTDYGFILNPDVVLRDNTIDEIILHLKKLIHFLLSLQLWRKKIIQIIN